MEYLITFLEGVISFISPCMLPMLPVYISYFAGATQTEDESDGVKKNSFKALPGALCFVLGFTVIFCLMGVFAGSVGMLLMRYRRIVNVICGTIVVILGLSFMELIKIPFLKQRQNNVKVKSLFSAFLFGVVFSLSITPCVGSFLGAALMMASTGNGVWKGFLLLLVYSLGVGIPFIISAVLINELKNIFDFIKRHYRIINIICGAFLIVVGIMMALGWLNKLMSLFSLEF
ncbi:MAG: cytochrome c biogenesis protein CcdA [Lachnospiraceae bacterium]|nr:cytochrome c biogenesis protein CcdA [Lachnospiraceae bacterium]MBQ9234421.1 cytochrome c biogenesis protein CcdA [Lachnospiraceae bacterium]